MKIGIIITQPFDPEAGGVQRVTDSISKIFTTFEHQVMIISLNTKVVENDKNTIPVINVTNKKQLGNILKKEKFNILINQQGYSIKLTKLLLKNKPNDDMYIINCLHINPLNFVDNYKEFVSLFFSRFKLKYLNNVITQKLILWYHIYKQRYELNYIIKNTNAFVMLSERFKKELYILAPKLKRYNHKIHGVNNPFERQQINISHLKKENIILFVGRLNILQKRVDLLMEIWGRLHNSLPDWKFWVVGEGEAQEYMKEFCLKNKLDRVIFFGKDIPDEYYKKAKLFHMTSAFEGFGNVLIEAQSYGCVPVLFNSYSAAQDIINHNKDGILVTPFDINEYIEQTKKLIDDPEKLNKMKLNAYENVSRFSFNKTYLRWYSIFNDL